MTRRELLKVGLPAAALLAGGGFVAASHDSTASDPADLPETSRILEVQGKRVHADVGGSQTTGAPTIILIHGASGNLHDMTFSLAPRLRQTHHVVAFDRPGLGHSEPLHDKGETPREQARHLAAAARKLGVERAIVVGHSYGGAVALAFALEAPDLTAGVVSLAGAAMPWPGELGSWYSFASSAVGAQLVIPVLSRLVPSSFIRKSIQGVFAPNVVPEGYPEHLGLDLATAPQALVTNARQVGSLKPRLREMSKHYNGITAPIEIIHGEADDTVPLAVHSVPLSETAPNARLQRLKGVGHMIHHAAEDETVAAIRRALSRSGIPAADSA